MLGSVCQFLLKSQLGFGKDCIEFVDLKVLIYVVALGTGMTSVFLILLLNNTVTIALNPERIGRAYSYKC